MRRERGSSAILGVENLRWGSSAPVPLFELGLLKPLFQLFLLACHLLDTFDVLLVDWFKVGELSTELLSSIGGGGNRRGRGISRRQNGTGVRDV
jgi:hypothetical protein